MECTDPDDSKRAAALKARTYRRGDVVDDSAGTDDDISAARDGKRVCIPCPIWDWFVVGSAGVFSGTSTRR